MKTHIVDAFQVTLAIVLTVGMIASAAPMPAEKATERSQEPQKAEVVRKPVIEAPAPVVEPVVQPEAPIPQPVPEPVQTNFAPGGNKQSWLEASGIPADQWELVDYIVSRESGWNPCAYYPSKSDCTTDFMPDSACGLVQTLPCGKAGANWRDPVAALQWQYNYVCNSAKFRPYGPCYVGAVGYWKVHGNY